MISERFKKIIEDKIFNFLSELDKEKDFHDRISEEISMSKKRLEERVSKKRSNQSK